MAELLLEKGLRDSQPNAEVRKVARTRTVSTLIQLDGKRARTVFIFLGEAQLREEPDPIISFEDADLSNAKWSEGNLSGFNLSKTYLSKVDLREASLFKTKLNETSLYGADLSRAKLREADLSNSNLTRANLNSAYLGGAKLTGVNLNDADLIEAKLINANLSEASLSEAYLCRANLYEAYLGKANLSYANLSEANLSKADLSYANLSYVNLSGAYLSSADFRGADLSGADFNDVQYLESAQFDKTFMRGVKGLTPKQLAHCKASGAIFDGKAAPEAPPAITYFQETIPQVSPSPGQAVPPTNVQEAAPEAATSQEHSAVEKGATPPIPSSQDYVTPLSSSQEGNSPVPPLQGNATLSSPSQDAAS